MKILLVEDDPSTAEILRGLAITCALRGETDEARELFDRAETILDAAGRPVDRLRDDRRAALDGAR